MNIIEIALLYSLIPFGLAWVSTCLLGVYKPKGISINIIQGTASAFILATIAKDLIPKILHGNHWAMSIGFAVGIILMVLVAKYSEPCCGGGNGDACGVSHDKTHQHAEKKKPLAPFLAGYIMEFFLVGLLIGITTAVQHHLLFIIVISVSLCTFVCSMSVSTRLIEAGIVRFRRIFTIFLMTLLFPLGALVGIGMMLYSPGFLVEMVFAFAVAILLYLATKELLMDAYRVESSTVPLVFFAAFLLVLLL